MLPFFIFILFLRNIRNLYHKILINGTIIISKRWEVDRMKLMFIGAAHEVTGSCHYLNACGKHILVDCGMEQGMNLYENEPLPVEAPLIDYVLLTHAHVDHSGMLPYLFAKGFRGQVLMTEASSDLCSIMLRDCAHIQMQEAEWQNRKAKRSSNISMKEPLYTMEDADGIIRRIIPCAYKAKVNLCEGIDIRFTDIGHLLGSSSIEIWINEDGEKRKIVFSGDIGNIDQPLLKDPEPTDEADYVVMESTYGDRVHSLERPDYIKELARIIQETFNRGGNVVIPSFAVGRTQEMLYFLRKIKQDRMIQGFENFPVYVDSPLAVEATEIFVDNECACYDEEAMDLVKRGINPIRFPGLRLTITSDESKAINFDMTPKVIISASGMCEAGRIRHHLKHNLWRPECTILFVGYQAVGTLGRVLLEGTDMVKLFGEQIEVRASIEKLAGISGHADKNGLIQWVTSFKKKPTRIFIVHGEDEVTDNFAQCLIDEYDMDAYAPYSGTKFNLITNTFEFEASPLRRETKKKVPSTNGVFERLLSSGYRLLGIIKKMDGRPNKEIGKFADQITSLCDKWDD